MESVRFLSPDVALMHALGGTVMGGKSRPAPERDSIQTLVAVKCDGAWRFTAFHNCRIVHRNAFQWMLYGLTSWLFDR